MVAYSLVNCGEKEARAVSDATASRNAEYNTNHKEEKESIKIMMKGAVSTYASEGSL